MQYFPLFFKVDGRKVIVTGAGEVAIAKLRLLMKTTAEIAVFSVNPGTQVVDWENAGLLNVYRRPVEASDFKNTAFAYAAEDDEKADAATSKLAAAAGVPFNIVDNLQASEFITPAIVDRDPVTIAIGTEGSAPVLARQIKSKIEDDLPASLGVLASIAARFRGSANSISPGRPRRNFWQKFFYSVGPTAFARGGEQAVKEGLDDLLQEAVNEEKSQGKVVFVGAGPGDPELLTRKAHKALHEADVIIYDRLISPQILELARREAIMIETGKKGFGTSWKQDNINNLMIEHAENGARVIRLKSGDVSIFGRLDEELDALDDKSVQWEIIPGLTTASVAAANLGISLTRRNRNSSFQILTGHDLKGFAEHDWRALGAPGTAAAIYMGLKSAHFISGRLLMHGCNPQTPITIVENVSRPDQKTLASTVGSLTRDTGAIGDGPAILLLGLTPRETAAFNQLDDVTQQQEVM